MNDSETRVNWRDIDTTTIEGLQTLKREIGLRLGYDADDPFTNDAWKDWQSDMNDALTLPVENEAHSVLIRYPLAENPNERYQGVRADMNGSEGRAWNANPATAYALAWLAWHDAAHKNDILSLLESGGE